MLQSSTPDSVAYLLIKIIDIFVLISVADSTAACALMTTGLTPATIYPHNFTFKPEHSMTAANVTCTNQPISDFFHTVSLQVSNAD